MATRGLAPIVDWISRGDGPRGPWLRLGLVVILVLTWGGWRSWRDGASFDAWAPPVIWAFFLVAPFILWRIVERSRRAERRRGQATPRINLQA